MTDIYIYIYMYIYIYIVARIFLSTLYDLIIKLPSLSVLPPETC